MVSRIFALRLRAATAANPAWCEDPSIMDVKRHQFMRVSAGGVAGALALEPRSARAPQPPSVFGGDAAQYGVRPGSRDDQSKALQRAIDEAARAQAPLSLPPGVYRTGLLHLQGG